MASLGASLPAPDPVILQRIPTFGDGIVSINVDTKHLMFSEFAAIEDVRNWVNQIRSPSFKFLKHKDYITAMGKFLIQNRFEASSALPHDETGSTNWKTFDVEQFCNALLEVMSDVSTGKARAVSFPERMKAHRIEFNLQNLLALRVTDHLYGSKAPTEVQRERYSLHFKKLPDKRKQQFKLFHSWQRTSYSRVRRMASAISFQICLRSYCIYDKKMFLRC